MRNLLLTSDEQFLILIFGILLPQTPLLFVKILLDRNILTHPQ